jgi:hypothetical protein
MNPAGHVMSKLCWLATMTVLIKIHAGSTEPTSGVLLQLRITLEVSV